MHQQEASVASNVHSGRLQDLNGPNMLGKLVLVAAVAMALMAWQAQDCDDALSPLSKGEIKKPDLQCKFSGEAIAFQGPILYWATYRGQSATVRALLAAGADPNARGTLQLGNVVFEGPSLTVAIERDSTWDEKDIIRAFLGSSKLDLEIPETVTVNGTSYRQPVLYLAVEFGNVALIEALLAAGADPDKRGALESKKYTDSILFRAVEKHNDRAVELLLAAGADPDQRGHLVTVNGPILTSFMGRLLSGDDKSHTYEMTPLMLAAWQGSAKAVRLLLKAGADPLEAGREINEGGSISMLSWMAKDIASNNEIRKLFDTRDAILERKVQKRPALKSVSTRELAASDHVWDEL